MTPKPTAAPKEEPVRCRASQPFLDWLHAANGSLVVTVYQAGLILFFSTDGQQLFVMARQFRKVMGVAVQGRRMALATFQDVVYLADAKDLAKGYSDQPGTYDALYLPRATYHTGNLQTHEIAFGTETLWVVNTRFSCLSILSKDCNFVPAWKPKFITLLAPEDRCHLNGLTLVDGKPKFVTALGETDTPRGWHPNKAEGGIIIDVPSNEVVCRGLCMPHSPRWHRNQLWVCNSGKGEVLTIDPTTGKSTTVCRIPAYLRGFTRVGNHAILGMSQIREKHIFGNLPIQTQQERLMSGVCVVDLQAGKLAGTLEFTAGCREVFDVQFLPGVRRPMILSLEQIATRQAFSTPDFSYWLRPFSADDSDPVENGADEESARKNSP
jgi:uncharacterized protein (TIGR03032 family)